MRDANDNQTAELPGLPPPPPPPAPAPPRPPQAARREAMQYQGPKVRQRCAECHHVEVIFVRPDSVTEAQLMRCKRGDFPVQAGAICADFAVAGPGR